MAVKSERELADMLNENAEYIELEGNLADHVYRIKATGKVAWAVATGAIIVAVALILKGPATMGMSFAPAALGAGPAISILGAGATASGIALVVAARNTRVLGNLRSYKIIERRPGWLLLRRP